MPDFIISSRASRSPLSLIRMQITAGRRSMNFAGSQPICQTGSQFPVSQSENKLKFQPDEVGKLRIEIDNLRAMSGRVAPNGETRRTVDGAGELLRQPSLESVASMASHRSSMSSSSKSSKADKASLNSFGAKSKKSWVSAFPLCQNKLICFL